MTTDGELGYRKVVHGTSFGRHGNTYETDSRGTPYFEEVEIINRISSGIPTIQVPIEVSSVLGYIQRTLEAGESLRVPAIRTFGGNKDLGETTVRAYEKIAKKAGEKVSQKVVKVLRGQRGH